MSALMDRALSRAIGQIGQKEDPIINGKGSNWGHPIQDYLASVDLYIAASWCMAFMYWCVKDAAGQLGMENPMKKTPGCLDQWHSRPANQILDLTKALPGDIFIMDHGHGMGHTGIIESVNEDGSFNTVEGNTNDTGSREGIEVCRKNGEHARKAALPIIGLLRF